MVVEEGALLAEYARENSLKTLELGQKMCKWGIPLALIITVLEAWTYRNTAFILCRLLFIVPATVYLTYILLPCSKDKLRWVLPLHLITLTGGLMMMTSLALIKINLSHFERAYQIASVTGGLVVMILVTYVFSAGTMKYLRYILILSLSVLLFYLLVNRRLTWKEVTLFINPAIAILSIIILSIHDEQQAYRDFRFRKEIERQQLKLQQQLKEDYLTGVYNRRMAFSLLDRYINAHLSFTLCYIDIDNFKMVNDRYGHSQGDILLIAFAEYLKENIRKSDFLCRIGGDEFLIILPDCLPAEAQNIVERIRKNCTATALINDIILDFSYGFSHYDQNKIINSYDLLEAADHNMYCCKATKN